MARRKTAAQKEREYKYAQAAENYRRRTDLPRKAYSGRQPRKDYAYKPLYYRTGSTLDQVPLIRLTCSELAVDKFTATRLNISASDTNLDVAIAPPTAFEPSMMRASVNRSGNPVDRTAHGGTGRPYRKYTIDSTAASKAHANAPVCVSIADTTPTLQELMLVIRSIVADKVTILGAGGGSISYSLETLREIEF